MATRQISFRPYRRVFRQAMRTSRGEWRMREGFLVRVDQAGRVGFGEVAPIPEFGSETLEVAFNFLKTLEADSSQAVPGSLPCCAFALSSALSEVASESLDYAVAGLLPAGEVAVAVAAEKTALGYRTLKWKVGVESTEWEQEIFSTIVQVMPKGLLLRLDANGAWSTEALECWLAFLQPFREWVEFIEQPLPVGAEARMAACSVGSGVAVALDESLNGPDGSQWLGEWDGPLVVKPLLMGDCGNLLEQLRLVANRVVLSSVFETGVGLLNVLRLADDLPEMNQAIGFDTLNFSDDLSCRNPSALLRAEDRAGIDPAALWNHLPQST